DDARIVADDHAGGRPAQDALDLEDEVRTYLAVFRSGRWQLHHLPPDKLIETAVVRQLEKFLGGHQLSGGWRCGPRRVRGQGRVAVGRPHRQAALRQVGFYLAHAERAEVEEAGGEDGVGAALREGGIEVVEAAGAAGRDYRHADRAGNGGGEGEVVAVERAVG